MQKHSKGRIQKIAIALLLALLMMSGSFPVPTAYATDVSSAQVMSAPLVQKSSAQNGMVRVYLSSLGTLNSLNLTVYGNYSINGDTSQSLSSGTRVTVCFSSSTGAITLTRNGVKTNMGTYFALRRHSASGTNGVKIAQARESNNLYPGDISFRTVSQGGSYKFYTVAHVYIENYLYGVLPYEMGNSTNIEALKAQAVAARTYTLRQMQSRASGYFDVYDTTSDQVYMGTPSGNANCVAAVNATKGIVLMYGSSYITTYYSASNGGQTEMVRTGSYPYQTVKDDPFDYANPSSTVKKATIYTNLASSSNNSSLMSLLKSKAVSKLKSSYGATSSNTTLQTLKSVTPHTPKYSSPSRLYTKVDFTMTVSVGGRSVSVTVTCDIFSELESILSMSIQSSKNELWSVQKNSSNFVLQARRFGHGYGMSQRGAMYMAKLGYTYDEILGFYYINCNRVQHSFTNTILDELGSTQTTVEDPAEIENDTSTCKGTVKLVSSGSSLAIRSDKSTTASLIGTAGNGAIMTVLSNDGTWCFVQYGNLKGYVPTNALSISGTPEGTEETPTSIQGFATVTASDFVNLRASGSMSAQIVSTAPSGAVLTVFSKSGSWAHVQYNATVAYANTGYISAVTTTYPSKVSSTGNATAVVMTEDGTGTVNLRASASTDASILAKIDVGTEINVTSDDGSWCIVSYNGQTGYMLSEYISYTGDSLENNTGGDGEAGGTTSGVTATVNVDLGYIREQADANAASVTLVAKGESVVVTDKGSEWCAVTYGDYEGYMLTSSLVFSNTGAEAVARAIVTTASGSLNLRAEATAGSRILTTIPRNAEIDVTSIGTTWHGVRYNGYSGYAMATFLTVTGSGETEAPSVEGDVTATVTTESGSLNLRADARTGSAILRTIPRLAVITVHQRGSEWCNVTYQGTTGYVMTVFLTFADENLTDDSTADDPTEEDPADDSAEDDTDDGAEGEDTDVNDPNEPLTPDPGTGDDTLYAVVTTVSGSLNLRRDALPGSDVLARIPKGTTIIITEKLSAWSQTTYAGQTGYVMNAYLTFRQGQLTEESGETATVSTASGSLNMRTEPSKDAGVLLRIPQYATVQVQQQGAVWCYVGYGGTYGYVMTEYLTFSQTTLSTSAIESKSDTTTTQEETKTEQEAETVTQQIAYVNTVSGSLNLRETATSGSKIITTIPRGAVVTVTTYGATWCEVTYGALSGFAMTEFLRIDGSTTMDTTITSAESQGDSQSAVDTTSTTSTTDGWVLTAAGSLNLRLSPSSGAQVLVGIPRLAKVEIVQQLDGWYYVQYNGQYGYVMSQFIAKEQPGSASTGSASTGSASSEQTGNIDTSSGMALDITLAMPDAETWAVVTPKANETIISMYDECSSTSTKRSEIPSGTRVEIILTGETWCLVSYQNEQGYVLTEMLKTEASE